MLLLAKNKNKTRFFENILRIGIFDAIIGLIAVHHLNKKEIIIGLIEDCGACMCCVCVCVRMFVIFWFQFDCNSSISNSVCYSHF